MMGKPSACQLVDGSIQVLNRGDFEGEVVQARRFGRVQRQDVVVGAVRAKEQLAAVLVDALETPAIVVELGLVAQVLGAKTDVRKLGN